nr:hypothetical protein [uncultured Caldimonas sp.]
MSRKWVRSWLFSKRVGWALFWASVLIGACLVINLVGIHLLGGIGQWEHWMAAHAGHFLVWRACLYAALGLAWLRLRRKVVGVDAPIHAQVRLLRSEIAAVVAIVVLESTVLLRTP